MLRDNLSIDMAQRDIEDGLSPAKDPFMHRRSVTGAKRSGLLVPSGWRPDNSVERISGRVSDLVDGCLRSHFNPASGQIFVRIKDFG